MFGRERREEKRRKQEEYERKLEEEKKRKKELERYLLEMFEWKEVSKEEWSSLPRKGDNIVTWHLAENYAETLFRKRASELGLSYDDVEDVFRGQNEQFFDSLKRHFYNKVECKYDKISSFRELLILPYQTPAQEIVEKIRKLSPEEQAEVLLLLVNKKIKIVVEDT